ncbi:hypothetical protein [Nonlabens ulvanivorans]|uniref:hypothetical protein n=1 Tax=Nonlabens ulvanivorans TaxID=906888 RepID=UPI0029436E70|nr:hypothetical protein [Nonlabens ulvanivorans]WOI22869.1 hypothetical protein R1T42_00175 [Nonlabens ulvanivorans]
MAIIDAGTGFSIELINWRLELRGEYKGLPLYEAIGGQVTAIALVETPAIGQKAKVDEKDQKLVGPVMIPDLKMFRNQGANGKENCYWYFSAETIEKLQKSFAGKIKIGH